ncbi:MAG: galactokinase [Candidatus Latescibacteria bacterium]|nr:galactokinase [Candidatus Latescibacterota bacterium]
MKITEVKAFLVDRYLLVRVYTDEGLVGNGEAGLWAHHGAVHQLLGELAQYYIGKDPLRMEHHYQVVTRQTHFMGAALSAAVSAIDIALWDILGKSVGLPVYQLLGGRCRDKIKVFANIRGNTLEEVAANARAQVERGFHCLRMTPFFPGFEEKTSTQVITEATAMVQTARQAIGDGVDLGLEIHRNLRPEEAIILARELEPFKILFYEDPLAPQSHEAMSYIGSQVRLPMAAGERLYNIQQFKDLIDRQVVSLIRADLSLAGGYSHCRKISALAEAAFVGIFPHLMGSPVNNAAFAHWAAAIPNYVVMEENLPPDPLGEIVDEQMPIEGGYRLLSDRPGIGLEIREDVLDKYPQKQVPINGYFHADGSVAH